MHSFAVGCYLPITLVFARQQDLGYSLYPIAIPSSISTNFLFRRNTKSISTALLEEVGMYDELDGIDIITDARHGWRKNAKDTSVVAVGDRSHNVLNCVHVTTAEDPVTQRHEKLGTEKINNDLENKQVSVNAHTHDRNMAINKYVKEREHGFTCN